MIFHNLKNGSFWVDSALKEYTGSSADGKVKRRGSGLAIGPHNTKALNDGLITSRDPMALCLNIIGHGITFYVFFYFIYGRARKKPSLVKFLLIDNVVSE